METEPVGRAKGGLARAESLSPSQRTEIAKRAAEARWGDGVKQATHGSPDRPLRIGDIEIPCFVLEDGERVITARGLIDALGMSKGGRGVVAVGQGERLGRFIAGRNVSPFVSNELAKGIGDPIRFRRPRGGHLSYGFDATILADLCEAVLAARQKGTLQTHQKHIAERCEQLVRGFARVGIIALVDEATGYQADRARDALARILEQFIAKELQPYVPTFQPDYYEQMFRLRGLDYPLGSVRRPQYFGVLTNDIVYRRLAPGVLEELKKTTPRREAGGHKQHLFRRLTSNLGYPKLREHLGSIVTIMKLSDTWHDFMDKLDRLHPRQIQEAQLSLDYDKGADDGRGI